MIMKEPDNSVTFLESIRRGRGADGVGYGGALRSERGVLSSSPGVDKAVVQTAGVGHRPWFIKGVGVSR